jgi:integrase
MEFVQPIKDKAKIEEMKIYLKSKSLRNWALFTLGINSALRISDLLALNVDNVMDEVGNIRERIKVKEIKTSKSKTFPFTAKVTDALNTYIKTEKPINALFPSRKGGHCISITRFQALNILKEAAKEVGIIDNIGTHSLRKTWAYQAYMKKVPLIKIMDALNHSSEAMTLRYLGLTQSGLDEVYMDMDL